jgi:dolichyl-phosphate beta-glucosyltransferase
MSLVVPAYNEAARLPRAIDAIEAFFRTRSLTAELILVDDGSTDTTPAIIASAAERLSPLVAVRPVRHTVNRGKGAAVRSGCLVARGRYVLFTDADLAVPIEAVDLLLEALRSNCDVAIGTRVQPDGRDMRASQPPLRRLGGRAFTWIRRRIAVPDIIDTQCPLKGFRAEAARRIFALQKLQGWAFDAELLFLARRERMRICQMPVAWRHVEGSKLRPSLRLASRAMWDLGRLRLIHFRQ